jgi:hypothetical protein
MNTKARTSLRSAPFYQVLIFAHGRKTQSGLPGYVANPLTIQQELSSESPTARERSVVHIFAHRPAGNWFGGYVALALAIFMHDFRRPSRRESA